MSKCKACGSEYRKGVIVTLLVPGKGVTGARVCQGCANGGMIVVAPKVAPVVEEKIARPDGYERALRQLRVLLNASHASARGAPGGPDGSHFTSRAEGIESAIEVVKRELGGVT